MKPFVEIIDGEVELNLHPGQVLVWDSKKRFVFALAGKQSGKTCLGPWWLFREIQRCGSGDYLAVTANYPLFTRKMLPELLRVFERTLKIGRYWGSTNTIEIKNPDTGRFEAKNAVDPDMYARILLASANAGKGKDTGVAALEAATAKAAWIDECGLDEFSLLAWEALQGRLSISEGRILGTTTLYNLGWMKFEIYEPWAQGDPDIDVIQFDSIENPIFPRAEYERMRRKMPTWKFNMQYRGQYDRPAGMIYSDFDSAVHLVEPFRIPKEWSRYVGIDPGPVHTATVWIAEDRDSYYIYQDFLEGNLTTKQHVGLAMDRAEDVNVNWVGGSKSEKQFRMDWEAEGIIVDEPPVAEVEAGIDRVISLLKEKRLFVFYTCGGLRDEIGTYARVLDERGESTEKIRDKESYHRLDALRYVISHIVQKSINEIAPSATPYPALSINAPSRRY